MYARNKEEISDRHLFVECSSFPKNVMISVGISNLGKIYQTRIVATKFFQYQCSSFRFLYLRDLEAGVWEHNLTDIRSLIDAIAKEWEAYPQINTDNAINSFKKQLQSMTKANERYIEQCK